MNGEDKQLRAMLEGLPQAGDAPDAQRLDQIRSRIASSLKPVRPLPSNRVLIPMAFFSFIALWLLPTILFGASAVHVFSGIQQFAYYGLIVVLAIFFAVATVEQMIPGSKRRVNVTTLIVGSLLSLALLCCFLFQNFAVDHFVEYGLPCLKQGIECALLSGVVAFFLVQKGFFTSPLASAVLVGCFAGLAGFAALAFICSFRNAPHILVWHLGTIMFGCLGGGVIGVLKKR